MADERFGVSIEAIDRASGVLKGISSSSDSLVASLTSLLSPTKLLGGVIGGSLVAGLTAAINETIKFSDQVRELSFLSGGSARDVSILVTGLEDLGVESSTVTTAMNMMSRAVESGSPALERLRISTRDSNGHLKTGLALYYEAIDALGAMRNEVERNSLAREIFGRGWTQMLPILREGSEKIRELGESNAALGKVMTEESLRDAREYKLALNELKDVWEALSTQLGVAVIPALTAMLMVVTPVRMEILGANEATAEWAQSMAGLDYSIVSATRAIADLDEAERRLLASSTALGARRKQNAEADAETTHEREVRLKRLESEIKVYGAYIDAQLAGQDDVVKGEWVVSSERYRAVQKGVEDSEKAYGAYIDAQLAGQEETVQGAWVASGELAKAWDQAIQSEASAAARMKQVWLDEAASMRTLRDLLADMDSVGLSVGERIARGMGTVGDLFTGDLGAAMGLPSEQRIQALTSLYSKLAGYGKELANLMKPADTTGGWGDTSWSAWPETAAEKYQKLKQSVKDTMAVISSAVAEAYEEQKTAAWDAWQTATNSVAWYRNEIRALGGDLDAITTKMWALGQAAASLPTNSLGGFGAQAAAQAAQLSSSGGTWAQGASTWGYSAYESPGGYFGGAPSYDGGGVIPGPVGRPYPIVAHGGEEIIRAADRGRGATVNITVNGSQEDSAVLARRIGREVADRLARLRADGQTR
jgi:hypothetical protein